MEPLPIGSIVEYHRHRHVITAHQKLWGLFTGAELDDIEKNHGGMAACYPDGVAYEIWQEGVERRFGNRAYSYYRVRRGSFTDTGDREKTVPVHDDGCEDDWSPRMRAARELAAEFGNDVEEWLV